MALSWCPIPTMGIHITMRLGEKSSKQNSIERWVQWSKEKSPRGLGYIGDCTTQLCGDYSKLGGGFKDSLFSPLVGEDSQFD